MKNWKSKLFGDNRMNFYGWICTGLLLIGLSAWLVFRALKLDALRSSSAVLLIAICLVLLGLFGLALQNYCARVAKAVEDEDAKKEQK